MLPYRYVSAGPAGRQVLNDTIHTIIEDPERVGLPSTSWTCLFRHRALRHALAFAHAVRENDPNVQYEGIFVFQKEENRPGDDDLAPAAEIVWFCTHHIEVTIEQLGEMVKAAHMEGGDGSYRLCQFVEGVRNDPHVPQDVKSIVLTKKEALDLELGVESSGLTHLAASMSITGGKG